MFIKKQMCSRQHMPLMLFFVDIAGQHVAEKQPV
jgi:hypothetical protein